jgi:hypothetical protein
MFTYNRPSVITKCDVARLAQISVTFISVYRILCYEFASFEKCVLGVIWSKRRPTNPTVIRKRYRIERVVGLIFNELITFCLGIMENLHVLVLTTEDFLTPGEVRIDIK